MHRDDNAYQAGRYAYAQGERRRDNPHARPFEFRHDDPAWTSWDQGWWDAQKAQKKKEKAAK